MSEERKGAAMQVHPLFRSWKLWYGSVSTFNVDYEESLIPIVTVKTVEDFYAMLHFMRPVHSMRTFAQLHFFQEGVKPMWEDSENKAGGKLWATFDNFRKNESPTETEQKLDAIWKNVLLALIGEVLEDSDSVQQNEIMGVAFSKKKQCNRVAIWVRDAQNMEAIERIRIFFRGLLPSDVEITWAKHGEK